MAKGIPKIPNSECLFLTTESMTLKMIQEETGIGVNLLASVYSVAKYIGGRKYATQATSIVNSYWETNNFYSRTPYFEFYEIESALHKHSISEYNKEQYKYTFQIKKVFQEIYKTLNSKDDNEDDSVNHYENNKVQYETISSSI